MKYNQNISPEELEEIERYLRQEMSAEEAEAVSRKVYADDSLARKVEEVKLTVLGINEVVLTTKLDEYHKVFEPVKSKKRTGLLSWKWALAASLLFIIAFSGWWFIQHGSSTQRIYSKYYRPDPGLMTLMSSGTNNYVFEKAMVEYKNGQYDEALDAWGTLLKESPDNDTLLYFMGAASQANANETAAIEYLRRVTEDSNSVFQKDAFWYLGLAYMNIGEKGKAVDNVKRSEHPQRTALIQALTQ